MTGQGDDAFVGARLGNHHVDLCLALDVFERLGARDADGQKRDRQRQIVQRILLAGVGALADLRIDVQE